MIARLTDTPERRLRAAIERSAGLEVEVTDRPPGAVVALVTCTGGCGFRHLLDSERHEVVLHHNATITCTCPSRVECKHSLALVAHEAGVLPAPPPPSRGFPKPCVVCGKPGFAILRGWDGHCEAHSGHTVAPEPPPTAPPVIWLPAVTLNTLAAPTVPSRPATRPAPSPARSRESSPPPGEGTVPAAGDTTPEGTA